MKKSKFFWVYSILLFSIAFGLILFSAFTGIRYREEQDETQALFRGAQQSITSLTQEKETLEKTKAENEKTILSLTQEKDELALNLRAMTEMKEKQAAAYEALLTAQQLRSERKKEEAKEVFDTIDSSLLAEKAMEIYIKLEEWF